MSAIVNAYVDNDDEHVVLLHRAENGDLNTHRVLADYSIYFARGDVPDALARKWRRDVFCRGYRVEGEWIRTRWRDYNARRAVVHEMREEGIATFEGDCSPVKRWMADHPDVSIQKPRRVYLDIETDSRVPITLAKDGRARVLVWCLVDEQGNHCEGVLAEDTDAAERVLLRELYAALHPFDQVCAWSGDDFDFPVISKRTRERRLGGGFPRRWLKMDHMLLYERLNKQVSESGEEKQSYALNAVAHAQLGEGKDHFDASRTYEAWEAGGESLERLVRYCVRDTDLMRRIEEKTGYLKLHQTIAEICGLFDDTWALLPTAQMDAYLLRLGHRRAVHFPTVVREDRQEVEVQYKGSYNKEPPELAGILRNVHVLDFSSMYPSIMLSWNMSYETRVMGPINGPVPAGLCRAPKTGICFRTDVVGIVPEAIEVMLAERKKWTAIRDALPPGTPEAHDAERFTNGFKVLPNSFYGGQGSPGSRFHDRRVAESISQTGAWLAEKTEWALVERYPGARVIYVDTDGLWLVGIDRAQAGEAVAWLNAEVYPKLLKDCGCARNFVKLAYEKEFERVVFAGAKNYIGRFAHYKGKEAVAGSKPEIKGVVYKRGDRSQLAREFQAEIIDLLMGGMPSIECACGHKFGLSSQAKECPACKAPRGNIAKVPGPTEDLAAYEEAVSRWRARILEGALAVEEIQTVKGLTKCVCTDKDHQGKAEHYSVRKSTKGNAIESPPHVRVGRMLRARGEHVGEGTKVAYVVVDASSKPQGVIPASDYDGTCDRRYLWESVWEPTLLLLRNAFPQHSWKVFGPPPKPRKVAEFLPLPLAPARTLRAKKESATGSLFDS